MSSQVVVLDIIEFALRDMSVGKVYDICKTEKQYETAIIDDIGDSVNLHWIEDNGQLLFI